MRRKLFVGGCPRSGTSALWRLLSSHPSIAIGLERYIDRVIPEFQLGESYFDKERFFTLEEGDTHFPDLENGRPGKYYKELKDRYDDCQLFGDKIPMLSKRYSEIFSTFPNAAVLYIFRDIHDVTNSYDLRFNGNHAFEVKWEKDWQQAISDWNFSLSETLKYINKGYRIIFVNYRDIYYADFHFPRLFKLLGLSPRLPLSTRMEIKQSKAFGLKRQAIHKQQQTGDLNEEQIAFIKENADFATFNLLKEKAGQRFLPKSV